MRLPWARAPPARVLSAGCPSSDECVAKIPGVEAGALGGAFGARAGGDEAGARHCEVTVPFALGKIEASAGDGPEGDGSLVLKRGAEKVREKRKRSRSSRGLERQAREAWASAFRGADRMRARREPSGAPAREPGVTGRVSLKRSDGSDSYRVRLERGRGEFSVRVRPGSRVSTSIKLRLGEQHGTKDNSRTSVTYGVRHRVKDRSNSLYAVLKHEHKDAYVSLKTSTNPLYLTPSVRIPLPAGMLLSWSRPADSGFGTLGVMRGVLSASLDIASPYILSLANGDAVTASVTLSGGKTEVTGSHTVSLPHNIGVTVGGEVGESAGLNASVTGPWGVLSGRADKRGISDWSLENSVEKRRGALTVSAGFEAASGNTAKAWIRSGLCF